jgi:hypothetical protein
LNEWIAMKLKQLLSTEDTRIIFTKNGHFTPQSHFVLFHQKLISDMRIMCYVWTIHLWKLSTSNESVPAICEVTTNKDKHGRKWNHWPSSGCHQFTCWQINPSTIPTRFGIYNDVLFNIFNHRVDENEQILGRGRLIYS